MALKLSVPIEDTARNGGTDEIETYFVPIRRLSLELNDHAHADTAEVVCDWKMTGADPRLLANAIGVVYLGNADENGFWEPTDSDPSSMTSVMPVPVDVTVWVLATGLSPSRAASASDTAL